jgi:hypothetical protein
MEHNQGHEEAEERIEREIRIMKDEHIVEVREVEGRQMEVIEMDEEVEIEVEEEVMEQEGRTPHRDILDQAVEIVKLEIT